ncbi:MAG TPA: hypothetical protein VGO57_14945 [Verrucomicrobiae bacterium]|jgi:multidrug efflux pump subunit AcrA (membrane-fusion protein)
MLLRISLIVAILAGLAAGGLGFYEANTQIPALTKQRDDENSAKKQALTELASTKTNLKKTQGELAQTQQDLSDTKASLDKAVARADAQERRAADLTDKLASMTKQRDDAQNDLAAFKATGLTPEQVFALNKQLKEANTQIAAINDEKQVLQRHLMVVQNQLDKLTGKATYIVLRADLKGKILIVDPKWDFVVLNVGDLQGALPDGELLVSRNGRLVAKVVISSVEKDRCIANIMPGWKITEPIEGDEVTPAHPAS